MGIKFTAVAATAEGVEVGDRGILGDDDGESAIGVMDDDGESGVTEEDADGTIGVTDEETDGMTGVTDDEAETTIGVTEEVAEIFTTGVIDAVGEIIFVKLVLFWGPGIEEGL